MNFDLVLRLLRDTYDRPQEVARWVMGLGITRRQALLVLGLVAVVTTFLAVGATEIGTLMAPHDPAVTSDPRFPMAARFAPQEDPLVVIVQMPFAVAVLQFVGMLFGAVMIHRVGRMFGGKGSWDQTLPLVAWLQGVFLILQAAQLLVVLALPMLALPVLMFTVFSIFFLTAHFIAALHGFASVGKVIGGMILTLILVSVGLSILFLLTLAVTHV